MANERGKYMNTLELLEKIANGTDSELHAYRPDAMNGQACAAITCTNEFQVIQMARAAGITGDRVSRTGRRVMVYWPGVPAE
jgi:hypothetical protein